MGRISKENYYLDIAETVIGRATCLRRCYGAIIVKNDEIISTGYNGAPRGRKNCVDLGRCARDAMNVPRGERYELCRSVHLAGKDAVTGEILSDATSCAMCRRLIINAGLEKVVIRVSPADYTVVDVRRWIEEDDPIPGT